jgi:hypothetical protein
LNNKLYIKSPRKAQEKPKKSPRKAKQKHPRNIQETSKKFTILTNKMRALPGNYPRKGSNYPETTQENR